MEKKDRVFLVSTIIFFFRYEPYRETLLSVDNSWARQG